MEHIFFGRTIFSIAHDVLHDTFAFVISDEGTNTIVIPYENLTLLSSDIDKLQLGIASIQKERGEVNVH